MNILKELLALAEDVNDPNLEVNKQAAARALNFTKEKDAAMARSKWHKSQAQKYKGKEDDESKAAYDAHRWAEAEWLMASQEYGHKSPKVAASIIKKAAGYIAKSKLAQRDVDAIED